MKRINKSSAFTLIELMIVVAIIGILAAVAIPRFADMINKSKEGATRGNLTTMKSSLNIYYGDNEGWYPTDTLSCLLTNQKYLKDMPYAKLPKNDTYSNPGHADTNSVVAIASVTVMTDGGGWAYVNVPSSQQWGMVFVRCTHQDSKGTFWSAY